MKVVEINGGVFGSTGKIMFGIKKVAKEFGIEVLCFSPVTSTNKAKEPSETYQKIGTYFQRRMSVLIARLTGLNGCFAIYETYKLIKQIEKYAPDIIHLHNLHDSYINLPMLFSYIKKNSIRVIWTLHDCWSFTGHCTYFTKIGCEKWKEGCFNCQLKHEYPVSIFDNSKLMWKLKKKWFTGIKDMTIVTPSLWLSSLVKESFLKEYSVKVINNGIDLKTFKFKDTLKEKNEYIILGVAFGWDARKGLDVFIKLSNILSKEYKIVLVGTDENIDKILPKNIISIHRTQNQEELASIYSKASVFLNPTREDNFPTVNMESLACGTPVITFNTGGSPEMLDGNSGRVIECDDIENLVKNIKDICEKKIISKENCRKRALLYDMNDKFLEYVRLYQKKSI